jgi:hypothetical protein
MEHLLSSQCLLVFCPLGAALLIKQAQSLEQPVWVISARRLNGSRNASSIPSDREVGKEHEVDHEYDNEQRNGVLLRSGSQGSLHDGTLFVDSICLKRVHRGENGSGACSDSCASRLAGKE